MKASKQHSHKPAAESPRLPRRQSQSQRPCQHPQVQTATTRCQHSARPGPRVRGVATRACLTRLCGLWRGVAGTSWVSAGVQERRPLSEGNTSSRWCGPRISVLTEFSSSGARSASRYSRRRSASTPRTRPGDGRREGEGAVSGAPDGPGGILTQYNAQHGLRVPQDQQLRLTLSAAYITQHRDTTESALIHYTSALSARKMAFCLSAEEESSSHKDS